MSKPSIVLLGAGGHAKSCVDVIEHQGRFTIAGFIGSSAEVGSRVLGYPILGTDADLAALRLEHEHAIVATGQIKSAFVRIRLWELLLSMKWQLPTIISPLAHASPHCRIGAGTVVMHGAVINAAATVGVNCIINSQALVEHDAVIGDHCHVATAAVVNGGVKIGHRTFIGSGSIIRQGLSIGENALIGMGQRVFVDCPSDTVIPSANGTK